MQYQLLPYFFAIAILAGPIIPLVLIDKRPQLLSPIRKLCVSLGLIGASFAIPPLIPGVLTGLYPLTPLMVEVLCPLFIVPQGFAGIVAASALLALKLSPQATRDAHHLWWIFTLLGVTWSCMVVLALGVSFADW